jgi:hypothetical protein
MFKTKLFNQYRLRSLELDVFVCTDLELEWNMIL